MQQLKKFSSHPKFDKARRKIFSIDTMSNEGNFNFILTFLLLVYSNTTQTSSPSTLRGGLVYQERTTQGPVYVNVETATIYRKADPSTLVNSAQLTRSFVNIYQALCRKVANKVTLFDKPKIKQYHGSKATESYSHTHELHFSPFKHPIMDAPQVCKEMGGRRPEIRDRNTMETIRFAAIKKNVQKISAGVYYDAANNIFRFKSDDTNIRTNSPFPFLEYGGYYEGSNHQALTWEDDHSIKTYAAKYPIIYNHPEKEFVIRLGDEFDKNFKDHIMCELPLPPPIRPAAEENNILLQVADHACKRDEKGLVASVEVVINEIEAITNLNVTFPEEEMNMDHFLPKIINEYDFDEKRKKRESPEPTKKGLLKDLREKIGTDEKQIIPLPVSRLYNAYRIRTEAGFTMPDFETWLKSKALTLFYHTGGKRHDGVARNWDKIFARSHIIQLMPYPRPQVIRAAQRLMSDQDVSDFAKLYNNRNDWFQRKFDEEVQGYLNEYMHLDTGAGVTRWKVLAHLTKRITYVTEPTVLDRTKRTPLGPLALIGIGLGAGALTNVVSSSVTGDAPLSWGGKTMGAVFGLQTNGKEQLAVMEKVGQALGDLSINQKEIAGTVSVLSKKMDTISTTVQGTYKATATLILEQDIKTYLRHLLLIQQDAIQKYAHVMLAASLHKTSPYALSQKELDKVADDHKIAKGIILAKELGSTRCSASIINNALYLEIEIPIIIDSNLFNFYKIKPIPVFNGNTTLMPEIDSENIAISKSGSEYALITNEEFDTCMNRPWKCHISTPIIPMSQQSHCVASTYISRQLTCPLQEINHRLPSFFHLDGNLTIYSVPEEIKVYIKCAGTHTHTDQAVTLRGMGEAIFKQSCTITLPNGAKYTTPTDKSSNGAGDLKIFELLRIHPIPTDVVIKRGEEIIIATPQLSMLDVIIPTKAELTAEAFHPLRSIPFLMRIGCMAAFFIFIALILSCCWPNIRAWLGRTWYCCCFGPTNEEKENERKQENARRLQRLTEELDIIKLNARAGAEKWRASTASIFSNIQRAKSMSSLREKDVEQNLLNTSDSWPPAPPPLPTTKTPIKMVYKAEPPTPILKRVSFDHKQSQ